LISRCLTQFLYNTRILNVMARTRRDFGSSRFWLVEYLFLVRFEKMISTLQQVLGLGWRTAIDFPVFD
jgi:hypothetical protein